jgi:hypothetical protein
MEFEWASCKAQVANCEFQKSALLVSVLASCLQKGPSANSAPSTMCFSWHPRDPCSGCVPPPPPPPLLPNTPLPPGGQQRPDDHSQDLEAPVGVVKGECVPSLLGQCVSEAIRRVVGSLVMHQDKPLSFCFHSAERASRVLSCVMPLYLSAVVVKHAGVWTPVGENNNINNKIEYCENELCYWSSTESGKGLRGCGRGGGRGAAGHSGGAP